MQYGADEEGMDERSDDKQKPESSRKDDSRQTGPTTDFSSQDMQNAIEAFRRGMKPYANGQSEDSPMDPYAAMDKVRAAQGKGSDFRTRILEEREAQKAQQKSQKNDPKPGLPR